MRYMTEENYQELVTKRNELMEKGELSQKMATGIALALGKLQKTE